MKRFHMSMDISGAIQNPQMFIGNITVDGKTLYSVPEIVKFFQSQLDKGRLLLPCSKCDNFDYQIGCLGHEA